MSISSAAAADEKARCHKVRRCMLLEDWTSMQVLVRFFAAHREATGQSSYAADLPDGSRASDVWALLQERFPRLASASSSVAFAVNQHHVSGDTMLHEGDELALLPPMAGG